MILLPVFIHVALTFVLLFWSARATRRPADVADTREAGWRDELELPVLFYVLTICAWQTQFADVLFMMLAWVFVALRVLHALPYEAASRPAGRNALFISSAVVLALMWIIYAARLLLILG
jgi:hypothetical protein